MAVEQKKIYGDIVTPSEGICEDVGVLVTTRDEKTAPPKNARLQTGHFMHYSINLYVKLVSNICSFAYCAHDIICALCHIGHTDDA